MKSGGNIVLTALLALAGFTAAGSGAIKDSPAGTPNETARLATFDSATGETSFALSLLPRIETPAGLPSDILIVVDTSASQTGLYQTDSIELAGRLLGSLNAGDRVRIAAIDLDLVQLQTAAGFVVPDSAEAQAALSQLRERVPLGSTDLAGLLRQLPAQFAPAEAGRNQNVVYIGDGVSRGGLVHDSNFGSLVDELAARRISLSTYAIGPERDVESMAALANMTGGNLFLDSDDPASIANGATNLAQTVHGQVFWPSRMSLPESVKEVFPRQVPPLRFDRDTIIVGTLTTREPWNLEVTGELNAQPLTLAWPLVAEESSEEFAFLPKLIDSARAGTGLRLPLLGSGGLREVAQVMAASSRSLTQLGTQALVMGNASSARELAEEAIANDGTNTEAELLLEATRREIQDGDVPPQDGEPAPAELPPQDEPLMPGEAIEGQQQPGPVNGAGQGALQLIGPVDQDDEIRRLVQESQDETGEMITDEQELARVRTSRMRAQVQYELTRATEELRETPGNAVDRLKSVLEVVDQTLDIDPSARVELRNRLESALASARQRKLDFDAAEAARQKSLAGTLEQQAALQAMLTREEEISRRLNRFSELLKEGNVAAAEETALSAYQLDPNLPETNAAYTASQLALSYHRQIEIVRMREVGFLDTLYETEKSATPFSGNPPLVFPDAEFWHQAKARREVKYGSVRLSGNLIDEEILRDLDQTVDDFIYDDTPFSEVMLDLKTKYNINIVLDQSAVEDSLTEDESVAINVSGIRLKNALRLLLAKYNATFIVRDEVLRIISKDVAEDPEFFVTNIYNVGDLVAPRQNFGGGLGGGGGGGGLGGFGGGQGGGGQGGGGLGGGAGGLGGLGGGAFCVQDVQPVATGTATEVPAGGNEPRDWTTLFANGPADPAMVRDVVRDLMESKQPAEVVRVIESAVRSSQSQPWMYEALALAMQVAGHSQLDVERAVMSVVDFTDSRADMLIAAQYLADNGMETRAIRLLRDIAFDDDSTPEVFVIGLRAASRINDLDGVRWATTGILSQAWPRHPDVFRQAFLAAAELQQKLDAAGQTSELDSYRSDLDEALRRDIVLELAWTGDADLDLMVEEPSGSVCSRQVSHSEAGGIMMGDQYPRNSAANGETREYYVLPRGFTGDYRALIRKVSGQLTGDRATVTIHGHYNSSRQMTETRQVSVDTKGTLVLFNLVDGRRTESVDASRLQRLAGEQLIVNREVLARQMNTPVSGSALGDYLSSREASRNAGGLTGQLGDDQLDGGLFRRPVGYQPVITNIFEGTSMQVNHATTADRLYVLLSVSPFFSGVTQVTTFNVFGNAANATGGGGGGGGLGGIGGGGGGGGLGGGGF